MPDPNICIYCEQELDDLKPYQRDLEGNGAHLECLPTLEEEDDQYAE
jgi:hypothetical protein